MKREQAGRHAASISLGQPLEFGQITLYSVTVDD